MKQHERIKLKLQWHEARMGTLMLAGRNRETASRQAFEEVCRLTDKDLKDFEATRRSEAQADRPPLPRCPICGGQDNCEKHWRGWTEDGRTLIPRNHDSVRADLLPNEVVQKTGVTARVYGPAPDEGTQK